MKKRNRTFLLVIAGILLVPVVLVFLFLVMMTIFYHRLPLHEEAVVWNKVAGHPDEKKVVSLLSWNIGYAGLGREMDFFYEGGRRVRPGRDEFAKYLAGVKSFLGTQDSIDFIFIQEADNGSKRSYDTYEAEEIGSILKDHCFAFAKNYDSWFVPLPLYAPMGKVVSGIATFSKYTPEKAERIGFGTTFPWPQQLFFLQRCFLVFGYKMEDRKELVIVNTHNSTFDEGGKLRKTELSMLRSFLLKEAEEGNWVIAGGDWNTNPAGFNIHDIHSGDVVKEIDPPVPAGYLPGWKFAYDPERPTNRDVDRPYRKGTTNTTVIDFFILSPNIELQSVATVETGFEFSDHQPVLMKVLLK